MRGVGCPTSGCCCARGGDDGYADELDALARELDLDRHISWLGIRDDVPDLLVASDMALLPSHQEGFSNAVLESMAAGLPVVATDVGGNAEAICDGSTGYIVPPHDPERLATAIVDLAGDASKRRAFGTRGRERVTSRFSLSACTASYDRLFSALSRAESLPLSAELGLPEIGVEPCVE